MSEMKRILVVDDNSANLTMINGILSGQYKVYPVDSGATALRFMAKQKPDLILLDIEMPGMSGIELFQTIQSDERLSDIPVIFLTAYTDNEFESVAFEYGASDYVRKPVSEIILRRRVEMHLELASLRAEKNNG